MYKSISRAKLEANRRNAQHSTGPRTEAGRAASSRNSRSHGLAGRVCLQSPEEKQAYAAIGQRLVRELKPCSVIEECILQAILDERWQMNRARALDEQMWIDRRAGIPEKDRPDGLTIERVSRYLNTHTRLYFRAVNEFRAAQAIRRREERARAILAVEQKVQKPYQRRKHGLILPPDGFVLSANNLQRYYLAIEVEAKAEIEAFLAAERS
jgi:hypothetical protein